MRVRFYSIFPVWRLRILRRRLRLELADSPVLRLLAAFGMLASLTTTLFLLMGGW